MPASSTPVLDAPSRGRDAGWLDTLRFIALTVLIALLLRSFVAMPRSIPSESMMPRLLVGDYVLVAKWPYGWSRFSLPWAPPLPGGRLLGRMPARGDVVVFRAPPDNRVDYIKRVIGLPGDRVAMRHGRLWLNGQAVGQQRIADFVVPIVANTQCSTIPAAQMPYGAGADFEGRPVCRFPRYRETLPGGRSYETIDQGETAQDDMAETIVPAGHYFLMGDNRDMSEDSRFPAEPGAGIGMVPAENLEGRAIVTILSVDGSGSRTDPASWWRALRPSRIGKAFR